MREEVGHLHRIIQYNRKCKKMVHIMYHIWQARQSIQSEYIRASISITCREYLHEQVWYNIAKAHCNRHLTMSFQGAVETTTEP